MKPNLVSIIIPHYARPSLLKKTLSSCLAQTYRNFEILVVDDGSPSEDLATVEKLLNDPRCRLIKLTEQRGPAHARNIGLESSQGEFVQFLDSDDFIHPRKLELQVDSLRKKGAQWVTSNWRIVFNFGILSFPFPIIKTHKSRDSLLLGTISEKGWFPVMSCLFEKSFLENVGPWLEYDFVEDREFRFRMLVNSTNISHVDQCLFNYNRYPFAARRNEVSYCSDSWNAFVMSNHRFIRQIETELSQGGIQGFKIESELINLRKILPLRPARSFKVRPSQQKITIELTVFFMKSFVRNWTKQIRSLLFPQFEFQMTGGDL